jgi:excisionase family DNA binding protein
MTAQTNRIQKAHSREFLMATASKPSKKKPPTGTNEVLTLTEAAAYLRVSEAEVLELARRGDVPGRKIGSDWRFHKEALSDWLRAPSPHERLMRHAGAAKGDPHHDEMLEMIYRERGRPMVEEG